MPPYDRMGCFRYEPGGSELNRYLRSTPAALLIAFALASIFMAGCSKDESTTAPPPPPVIEVSGILCNPLSPAPGDTARLTVRAEGQGAGATYEWQVEAGTLIGGSDISVEWAVPADPGVYMVTARSSVGSAVSRDTAWVMVRRCEAIDAGLLYAFYPTIVEGELYLVGTNANPSDRTFLGYHAYKGDIPPLLIDKLSGTTVVNINGGYEFQFFPDGILTASVTDGAEYIRLQPTNVIYFPYIASLAKTFWSNNEVAGTTFRKNQNIYPSINAGLEMVVWQRNRVGATDDGKKDLVNIRFRFANGPIQTLTTAVDSVFQFGAWNYTYWRNIKPLFAPDESMIIYFNDSTETFEPCLIPIEGSTPNVANRRALMVDSRHGIFYYASYGGSRVGVKVSEKTIFQWNPANPAQVAFIDDDRRFCVFDYVAETVEIMAEGLTEFVYAADGTLAAVAEDGIYILEPGQTEAKRIFTKERATDAVVGINWSPGLVDRKLGFRMVRKGASSLESYSVLVIYSADDDRWYYASPEIKPVMGTEPLVKYTWMRAVFDPFTGSMYVPVPLSTAGGRSVLYRSYRFATSIRAGVRPHAIQEARESSTVSLRRNRPAQGALPPRRRRAPRPRHRRSRSRRAARAGRRPRRGAVPEGTPPLSAGSRSPRPHRRRAGLGAAPPRRLARSQGDPRHDREQGSDRTSAARRRQSRRRRDRAGPRLSRVPFAERYSPARAPSAFRSTPRPGTARSSRSSPRRISTARGSCSSTIRTIRPRPRRTPPSTGTASSSPRSGASCSQGIPPTARFGTMSRVRRSSRSPGRPAPPSSSSSRSRKRFPSPGGGSDSRSALRRSSARSRSSRTISIRGCSGDPAGRRRTARRGLRIRHAGIRAAYRERRDILAGHLERAGFEFAKPRATFYFWIRTPGGMSSMECCRFLIEELGIVATPGVGFGAGGEGYFRLSITADTETVREAGRRLESLGARFKKA